MKAKHLLSMAFALVALASCAKEQLFEQEGVQEGLIPISVNSSINQQATKATADGFVGGDAVGLFAVNYINDNAQAGTLVAEGNQADNVKYVFDETNHKWVPVKSVYYKDINTHADLYLYYPYQKSISDVNAAGFEVQKDQSAAATETSLSGYEASDFLWGKGEDITPSQSAVNIKLSHKMAAVQVTLIEGDGFEEGEFESLEKSIILTNTTRKATIDYATGNVTPLGAAQNDGIVMCPQSDGSWRAIVVPQSISAGIRLFAITINGISYSFKQGDATEYQSGKQTNFTISIKKKTDSGTLEFTLTDAQITDWTEDLNTHGGEARQYFVVNVTEPGTLGATIQAMGKNPDKIRNLKVVGTVRDDDFYFMRDNMAILEAINMKESIICKPEEWAELVSRGRGGYEDDYYNEWYYRALGDPEERGNINYWELTENVIPPSAFEYKNTLCYFTFPENVSIIGPRSFYGTKISGALVIPDGVKVIMDNAFSMSNIGSVSFPESLKYIFGGSFSECTSLSGTLILPSNLLLIGSGAFGSCNFTGELHLPDNLEDLGSGAFNSAGNFVGGLKIPDKIHCLRGQTFLRSGFTGTLDLNNVTKMDNSEFQECGFSGDLIIPEGTLSIPAENFYRCDKIFSVKFPSTLKEIGPNAFYEAKRLSCDIILPEGFQIICEGAFFGDNNITGIELPSTIQTLQGNVFNTFNGSFYVTRLICNAIEPPTVMYGAFDGVAKDNFAVEVPEQSIIRYQTESGWSDFKRITAHYDFSMGRMRLRLLNKGAQKSYVLRCPAGMSWSVTDKPDWVEVSPISGTGRTDVSVTVSDMARTDALFEVNEGSFNNPTYKNYKGRNGRIIFKLGGKDYTCSLEVEQYDYNYAEGDVIKLQSATVGNGIDLVFIGEGYDAKDLAGNLFAGDAENCSDYFFNIEPYKTYKDYFNVYSVITLSGESGIETVNTIIENKFINQGILDVDACFEWAKDAVSGIDITKTPIVLLENVHTSNGMTYMYADGSALSVVPISQDSYPYDLRGLVQHEVGGHAFGKLGDEWISSNAYITACPFMDGDHPSHEDDETSAYGLFKSFGWYKNLSMYSDWTKVPWYHMMYHPKYSDRVDMYEGAYKHSRGIYRSEATSCMNNNIPYFNAISRQAIVERIKEYAGGTFDFDDFVANDNFDVGTKASIQNFDWTFGVDPKWNRGAENGSIIFMGEHPNVK